MSLKGRYHTANGNQSRGYCIARLRTWAGPYACTAVLFACISVWWKGRSVERQRRKGLSKEEGEKKSNENHVGMPAPCGGIPGDKVWGEEGLHWDVRWDSPPSKVAIFCRGTSLPFRDPLQSQISSYRLETGNPKVKARQGMNPRGLFEKVDPRMMILRDVLLRMKDRHRISD